MTTLKYSRSRASDKLIFIQFRQKALGNLLLPALLVISLTSVALAHQAEYQIEQLNQQSDQDPYGYAFAVDSEQSPFAGQQQINIGGSNFGNRPVAGARPNRPDFSSFGLRPTTTTSTTESPVQQQEQLQQQQQNEESDGQQQQQQQLPGSGRPNLDLNGQQIVQQDDDSSSNGNEQTEGQTSDEGQQEQVNENEDTTGGLNQAQPTRAPSTSTGGSSRPGSSTFTSNGAGVSQRPTASRPINPSQGELQQIVNGGDAQQQSEDGQEGQQAGGNDESTGSNDGDEQQQQVVESTTTRRPILQRPSTSRRPVSFTTTTTTTSAPISQENEGQSFDNNQDGQQESQDQQQDDEQQAIASSSTTTPAPSSSTRSPIGATGQQVKSSQQGPSRLRASQLATKSRPTKSPRRPAPSQQGSQQLSNLNQGSSSLGQNGQQLLGQRPSSGFSNQIYQQQLGPSNNGHSGANSGRPNGDLQQIVQQNNLSGNEDESDDSQSNTNGSGSTGAIGGGSTGSGFVPNSRPSATGNSNQQRPNSFKPIGSRPVRPSTTTELPVSQQQQVQQNEDDSSSSSNNGDNNDGSSPSGINDNDSVNTQQQQEQQNQNEETVSQATPTRAPLSPSSQSSSNGFRPSGQSGFNAGGNNDNANVRPSSRPTFGTSSTASPQLEELQQVVNGGDAQQQSEDGQEGQQAGGNDESTGSNDGDEQQQQVVESTTTRRPILQRPSTSRRPVSFTTTTTTTSAPISQENEGQSFENNQTGGNLVDNNQEGQQEQQQDEEQQGNVLSSTTSTTTTSTTPAPISSTRAPTAVSGQQVKSLQQGATRSRVNQLPAKGRPVATPMAVAQQQQRQQAKTIEPTRAIPVQATKNSGTVARQQLPTATFIPGKGSRRPQSAFGAPAPAPSNLPTAVPFSSLSQQLQVMPAGLDQVNDGFSQPAPVAPVEAPQFIMIPMPVQQQVFEVPQEAILPQAGNDRASQLQQQILTGPIMEPTFQARPPKPITSGQQQQQAGSIKSVPKPQTSSNLRATNAATKQGPRQLGWMNNLISNGANKPTGQSAGLQVQPSNLGSSNQSVKGNQQPSQSGQTTSGATKTSRTPSASNGGVSGAQASGPRAATKNQQSGLGAQPQSQSASQSVSPSRASTKGNSEQEAPRVPQSQLTGPREVKTSQQRQQSAATSGQVASSLKAPLRSSLPSKQARPTASGKTSTSGSSGPRFQPILSNNADNAQTTQGGLTSQTSEAATSENNGSFNGPSTSGEANQRPVVNGSGLGSSSATKGGRVQAKPSDGRQPVRMSPGAKSRLATKSLMAQQQQQQQLLIN